MLTLAGLPLIRLAFTLFTAFLATLVAAPLIIVAWPWRRDGEIGFRLTRWWSVTILRAAGVSVTAELLARLPDRPVVFVSNHVSALDIPILFVALPRSFRIVYKSSLAYVPLMGLSLVATRHVSIDRSRAFSAKRSLGSAARRIRSGVSVALFPEGTRSGEAPMGPFKRGGFKLAIEAQAPVVPVSLIGLRQVICRNGITPGHVRVRIHGALDSIEGPVAIETLVKQAESVIREEVEP